MADVDDIITTSEAAEIIGVTAREVRRKASEGTLPAFRVEGAAREEWRFYRTDVVNYLQQRDEEGADGRTDLATVRRIEQLTVAQERNTEAALTLAGRLGDLADLRDTLAANTEAQGDLTGAVRDLVTRLSDELAEVRAERDRLAAQAEEAEREAEKLAGELEAERSRSWWQRLTGQK